MEQIQSLIVWVQEHWVHLIAVYLAVHKFLVALRDTFDKTPQKDDNWFERLVTAMGKLTNYLTTGQRPK